MTSPGPCREAGSYDKLGHPWGDDYENWLAAEQRGYYRGVIV